MKYEHTYNLRFRILYTPSLIGYWHTFTHTDSCTHHIHNQLWNAKHKCKQILDKGCGAWISKSQTWQLG